VSYRDLANVVGRPGDGDGVQERQQVRVAVDGPWPL
jgi:hypothetical protein